MTEPVSSGRTVGEGAPELAAGRSGARRLAADPLLWLLIALSALAIGFLVGPVVALAWRTIPAGALQAAWGNP
ncbi:MAG TPA: hypothetical protein VHL09_10160, partial [Dehalococcoidia bacterium]|nr:hypothetical protein [Dehalococcoidia bacterium]